MIAQKPISLASIFCLLVVACDIGGRATESEYQGAVSFVDCANTFVVSGSRKIYLFEHRPYGVEFKQLADFDDWAPLSAYLDCDANRIIAPYGARKGDRNNAGVAIIDLATGVKSEYPLVSKGIQGIPIKYRNGILLGTTLLQRGETAPSFGYMAPGERYTDKSGENYRIYTPTVFFDLNKLQFTREFDIDIGYAVLADGVLTAKQRGAITAIDLQNKTTEVLFESPAPNDSDNPVKLPMYHLNVFVDGNYYMVLNSRSYNKANFGLSGYQSNGIYQLVDGSVVKLANIPYEDSTYLLGIENKLYIFTSSFKAIEFDIRSKSMLEYDFSSAISEGEYQIESVGYTNSNFIIAMGNRQRDQSSKVLLVSRDFKQISAPYNLDLRLISITTNLAIDTADTRGVSLFKDR